MGSYTIRLSPTSQDMTKIVTEFGKFKYNFLPMGMCASGDIFPDKLYELLGDIEGVKTCIDNILVLNNESSSKHIEQLRIIYGRLCTEGLQVDAPKCSFVIKYIPYLGFVITQEGIKSETKKV